MSQKKPNNDLKAAIWVVAVAVVVIAAIVLVKVVNNGTSNQPASPSLASPALMAKITSLEPSLFESVGQGTASKLPQTLPTGTPVLTSNGLPEIVFVGAEYCPFCATERWPMVIALSRFGTFSNLGLTTSSASDVYPSTATFAFHGSTYSSKYIVFTPIEETTNQPDGAGGYVKLDTPTVAQQALINTYDAPPYVPATSKGSIPFIYFGGQFLITGSTYDPGVLQGKTQDEIATDLSNTSSDISKGAVGAANSITATICTMTNNQPSSVCDTSMIKALQAKIGK